jgi:hypothetical protein
MPIIALVAMHEQEADVLRGGGAGRAQRRRGLPVGARLMPPRGVLLHNLQGGPSAHFATESWFTS